MTLDLQGTPGQQTALWAVLRSLVPMLAQVPRLWLEPSGARCTVLGGSIEIDLGLDVDGGALRVAFEAAREKTWLPGSHKLPDAAWRWQVKRTVAAMQLVCPPHVSLDLDTDGRFLQLWVKGVRFVRCLVSGERLILEMIADA